MAIAGGLLGGGTQHRPAFVLPGPSGPYAVGRIPEDWADAERGESLVAEPGIARELRLVVWYPAAADGRPSTLAEHLPDRWRPPRQPDRDRFFLLARPLASVRVHAVPEAPVAPSPPAYPVLIMQPAISRLVIEYTTLAEELASHGYVVVGVMPKHLRGGTLDEVLAAWAADDVFVLNRLERLDRDGPLGMLTGRLALTSVGVFGHSFGGAAALEACRLDPRFKAGVDIDGYPAAREGPLRQPFMFIWSEPRQRSDPRWQQARRDAGAVSTYQVLIRGTRHFNFSDHAALHSPRAPTRMAVGPIDGPRGLRITTAYVRAFFDRHLKGTQEPLLTGTSSPYPEVEFESR